MSEVQRVSRREFLGSMFSAGALILAASLLPVQARDARAAAEGAASPWSPSVYLGLEPTGAVIIVAHRSEMGTGIRTALPMVAADELEADWQWVTSEQAIGDPQYGDQNTDGSKSIRDFYAALRQAGATGRLMLERAAAATWSVPVSQCQAFHHQMIHVPSGQRLGYGELVPLAAQQPVPTKEELRFKSPAEFRYVGIGVPIVDLEAICTGKATYGFDAQMPGMVYASIACSPVLGGTLTSYDDQATRQVRGVQQTVVIPPAKPPYAFQALGGVAVIADSTWAAMQGRQQLKVAWDPGEHASYDSEAYKQSLFATAETPQTVVRHVGDVDAAFARAGQIHEAAYYVPLLAHASLEPPAAVAEYKDGKVVAGAATQNLHRGDDVHEGGDGCAGAADGMVTKKRVSADRFDLRRLSALRSGRRAGSGVGGPAVRHPEPARRERTGAESCAHRLAALGGQYLPRLRHPILHR
jgi:isoquinoline 1-oxidoreductase beta subunit